MRRSSVAAIVLTAIVAAAQLSVAAQTYAVDSPDLDSVDLTPIETTVVPARTLKGIATWYVYHKGQAAAGPRLRHALGSHWRGRWVTTWYGSLHVRVRLTDSCVCPWSRVIDLDYRDFGHLRPTRMGIASVVVAY